MEVLEDAVTLALAKNPAPHSNSSRFVPFADTSLHYCNVFVADPKILR
jgi:hypothetical protein